MKKVFFSLATVWTFFASCGNSDEVLSIDNSVTQDNPWNIVVEGDSVVSPRWIQEKRWEMCSYDPRSVWAVCVYTCKWKGETYVTFWNQLSSYIENNPIYDQDGNAHIVPNALVVIDGKEPEVTDFKRICPTLHED